jgi:hypothetical protein
LLKAWVEVRVFVIPNRFPYAMHEVCSQTAIGKSIAENFGTNCFPVVAVVSGSRYAYFILGGSGFDSDRFLLTALILAFVVLVLMIAAFIIKLVLGGSPILNSNWRGVDASKIKTLLDRNPATD